MKIYIGADHLGVKMKDVLVSYLKENNIDVVEVDIMNHPLDNYTDFAFEVGEKVTGTNNLGILICGNGVGMSIAANKVKGIRCARVLTTEDAFKCKNHNGANIISLSSEVDIQLTKEIVDMFISTEMVSNEKYIKRVNQIKVYEGSNEY